MPKISGATRAVTRINSKADGPTMRRISSALFVSGEHVQSEAQISITDGSTNAKGQHQPSLPGQPPNNEYGTLAGNIETIQPSPFLVQVSSNAKHAIPLEYGTSKMAERPYMRPALEKSRPTIASNIAKAIGKS